MIGDLGPVYTTGNTYRARAEARQRKYRAEVLRVDHGRYGHFLAKTAAENGANFVLGEAIDAAHERQQSGKGVAQRTFENMLSSQAMCFNVFAPLASRLELASEVLGAFVPDLAEVTSIHIEHTPARDIFNDQSGRGGVDCDLLVEGLARSGNKLVLVVETKFVEPEFSVCGFRKPGRAKRGQDVCPDAVRVHDDRDACLYVRNKRYSYWARSDEFNVLADGAVPTAGCPFAGDRWQLWVNLALAHTEADRRGAPAVEFAVCASSKNTALLGEGEILDGFRHLLRQPERVRLIDLDSLLERLASAVPPELSEWSSALSARYFDI